MYWIVNMTRHVTARTKMSQAPARHRYDKFICNGRVRLVPDRPQPLRPDYLEQHYDELYELQKAGVIQVRVGALTGPAFNFDPVKAETCKKLRAAKGGEVPGDVVSGEPYAEVVIGQEVFAPKEEPKNTNDVPTAKVALPKEEDAFSFAAEDEKPDFDHMNKADLIDWLCKKTQREPKVFEGMTKKQLLKEIEVV